MSMSAFPVHSKKSHWELQGRGEGKSDDENSCNCNEDCKHTSSVSTTVGPGAGGDRGEHGFSNTIALAGKRFPYFDHDECDNCCLNKAKYEPKQREASSETKEPYGETGQIGVILQQPYKNWSLEDLLECIICRDILIEEIALRAAGFPETYLRRPTFPLSNSNDPFFPGMTGGSFRRLTPTFSIILLNKQATVIGCGHTFCSSCLREWLKARRWCPICQQSVKCNVRNLVVDRIVESVLPSLPTYSRNRLEATRNSRLCKLRRRFSQSKRLQKTWLGSFWLWTSSKLRSLRESYEFMRNKGVIHIVGYNVRRLARLGVTNNDHGQVKSSTMTWSGPVGFLIIGMFLGWLVTSTHICSLIRRTLVAMINAIDSSDQIGCPSECRQTRNY